MSDPVLSGRRLSVTYGGVRALRDLDIDISAGEIVGLIGPNGAGKTSFIDGVTGFAPMSGQLTLLGREAGRVRAHRRSSLGLSRTWQSVSLFDDLTVRENTAVAARRPRGGTAGGSRGNHVTRCLRRLGIDHLADRLPGELSHGQRVLVGVARAIAAEPRIVLMDEPAAGLDDVESRELGRFVQELAGDGIGVVLVDHDMDLVLDICHKIYVLDFGQLIASGTPAEVRENPAVISAYLGTLGSPGPTPSGNDGDDAAAPADVRPPSGVRPPSTSVRSVERRPDQSVPSPRSPVHGTAPDGVLLETRSLSAGYDGVAVTHDVSLTVAPAEIVCLLGPNGAGKTTTLLTVSGLLGPIRGSVHHRGRDLRAVRADARSRLGIVQVSEERSLFGSLTVRENLQVASRSTADLKRVYEYFPKLREIENRRAGVLSGGEQQMLSLARALMLRPEVLIVDEMSLGLAPVVVEGILPVLRRIVDDTGAAVLMVEQHVHLALSVADRAYVMSRGHVVGHGAAEDIAASLDDLRGSYLGADRPSPSSAAESRDRQ